MPSRSQQPLRSRSHASPASFGVLDSAWHMKSRARSTRLPPAPVTSHSAGQRTRSISTLPSPPQSIWASSTTRESLRTRKEPRIVADPALNTRGSPVRIRPSSVSEGRPSNSSSVNPSKSNFRCAILVVPSRGYALKQEEEFDQQDQDHSHFEQEGTTLVKLLDHVVVEIFRGLEFLGH